MVKLCCLLFPRLHDEEADLMKIDDYHRLSLSLFLSLDFTTNPTNCEIFYSHQSSAKREKYFFFTSFYKKNFFTTFQLFLFEITPRKARKKLFFILRAKTTVWWNDRMFSERAGWMDVSDTQHSAIMMMMILLSFAFTNTCKRPRLFSPNNRHDWSAQKMEG